MAARPERSARFRYGDVAVDEAAGVVQCHYLLDDQAFVETVLLGPGRTWTAAAHEAARLVHLLAGVSYFKAGAPRVIDLGNNVLRPGEEQFLRAFYIHGLGEFSYTNGISLDALEFTGGHEPDAREPGARGGASLDTSRVLIPFGGGIDSLVTVDSLARQFDDISLFIANRANDRFQAIERSAAATSLPVLRAEREIDKRILNPGSPDSYFNGHVPITGILSAIAVLVAILDGRGMVVMSNEWSASRGNIIFDGRPINHQFSKSEAFETSFRSVLAAAFGPELEYFSFLRPFSELWVAERFSRLPQFHAVVHSCNRAFSLDAEKRLETWCGRCDKCCFIDLILAPFMERVQLDTLFHGNEPLSDPSLLPSFRDLLGIGEGTKPFECVGDVDECRTALTLASEREDRSGNLLIQRLLADLGDSSLAAREDAGRLLSVLGPHHIPDAIAGAALV